MLVAVPSAGTRPGPPKSVPGRGSSPALSMENFIPPSPLGCSFPTTSHARPGLSKINPVATVTQSRDAKYTGYRYFYIYLTAMHRAREPEQGTRSPTGSEPCRPQCGSQTGTDPSVAWIPAQIQAPLGSPEPTWWLCLCHCHPVWHSQTSPATSSPASLLSCPPSIPKSQLLVPAISSSCPASAQEKDVTHGNLKPGVPRDSLCLLSTAVGEENSIFDSKKWIITGFCTTHKIPALIGRAGRKGKLALR